MEPFQVKNNKKGPEAKIQDDIIIYLKERDWDVIVTHGNVYQHGLPDLYCMHDRYGARWIEVKNPEKYSFTKAQRNVFPRFAKKNIGIWILTAATKEEYDKLFEKPNWWSFFGKSSV